MLSLSIRTASRGHNNQVTYVNKVWVIRSLIGLHPTMLFFFLLLFRAGDSPASLAFKSFVTVN